MKKRENVNFDKRYFSKKLNSNEEMSAEEKFKFIYQNNFWVGKESVSGEGSDELQTRAVKEKLPTIISQFEISKILDIPCGDFKWMKDVDLDKIDYVGADIVEEIIINNRQKFLNEKRKFEKLDLLKDDLPKSDLVFCRDCLVHLSNEDIFSAIENIKRSSSKYLLTTTFTECEVNENIITGDWRIINLTKEPFNFHKPLIVFEENCTEGNGTYSDKSLGLWKISDLK